MHYCHVPSPVGDLLLAADDEGLRFLSFPTGRSPMRPHSSWQRGSGPLKQAIEQLDAYFAGELTRFDLKLAPQGNPFQLAVWRALLNIPYGQTKSYGEIAREVGDPGASRPVGAANGANPIAIVIPCHRVIGSTGKLTGFGGGIEVKAALLTLEGVLAPDDARQPDLPFAEAG